MTYAETALVWIHGGISLALGLIGAGWLIHFTTQACERRRYKKWQMQQDSDAAYDARVLDAIVASGVVSHHKPIRIYPTKGAMGRKWVVVLADGGFSDETPSEQEALSRAIVVAYARAEKVNAAAVDAGAEGSETQP